MKVKIEDYGFYDDKGYVIYKIADLSLDQLRFLDENIEEKTLLNEKEKYLILTMYYDKRFFPFESTESKEKLEDYIAREEIEIYIFISSYLEDF